MSPRHVSAPLLLAIVLFAAGAPTSAGADAQPEARFAIQPAGSGAQRLDLPPAMISASARGGLEDLRLADSAGREVPYLLVPPPPAEPERWVGVTRIRAIPPTPRESGAELDLGSPRAVTALEVELPDESYLKRVRLDGSGDGRRWAVLVPQATLYELPLDVGSCGRTACPRTLVRRELRFDTAVVRYLRLVVDDRRGARVGPPSRARALLAPGTGVAGGPLVPLVPLEVTRREGEPHTSRFALRLPGPHLPVRAVVLEVDAPRLARPAQVLEAHLDGGRLAPVELGNAVLVQIVREGDVASALRIPVRSPEELELELVVEDGNNPPLQLRAARAELAPLPWVFFESLDGAAIEARLGDPALAAPRYDLEALRPKLEPLHPAHAVAAPLGPAPAPPTTPLGIPEAARAGAILDLSAFRHARTVAAGDAGLAAVRLDAEVLSRSSSLSDLRLAGPDGRQIPYLLERRDEPLAAALADDAIPPGQLPRELAGAGRSLHPLRAPVAPTPPSQLVLETGARVFTRRIQVWAKPSGAAAGAIVAEATWSHTDPDQPAQSLVLELPPLADARVVVAVGDGDNAPLPLVAARLQLPSYRLRFFHPGAPLTLHYGADLPAPQYDLALLAPRLRAAPAREVPLGPAAEGGTDGGRRWAGGGGARLAFWIVLGVAVLGLLALVARLLARGENAPP